MHQTASPFTSSLRSPSPQASTPAETGTIEEWWSGPNQMRVTYDFPSYQATIVRKRNDTYQTPDTPTPPYLLRYLLHQETQPLESPDELRSGSPDRRKEAVGGDSPLDCIMVAQPTKGYTGTLPLGLFPTYCLEPGKLILRATVDAGSNLVLREHVGLLRGISTPIDLSIYTEGKRVANAHTERLDGQSAPYPETLPTMGLEPRAIDVVHIGKDQRNVTELVKGVHIENEYKTPREANGTVLLHLVIGTDGHVESLVPVSFPTLALVVATAKAVLHWEFKPYMLNGVPREFDCDFAVGFDTR